MLRLRVALLAVVAGAFCGCCWGPGWFGRCRRECAPAGECCNAAALPECGAPACGAPMCGAPSCGNVGPIFEGPMAPGYAVPPTPMPQNVVPPLSPAPA